MVEKNSSSQDWAGYGVSWRAVNNMCTRVAEEALGRVDLLDELVAIAIDEVKYKKGHKYLTVVCDHITGTVVWAATGRSKDTVGKFFDALGDRTDQVVFVTADGATWITDVVAERAPPRHRVPRHVPCDQLGHRRVGRGPPERVEQAPPRRTSGSGPRVQGVAVLAAPRLSRILCE